MWTSERTEKHVCSAGYHDYHVRLIKKCRWQSTDFGEGRGVYISGLPYSFENSRVLYRAILCGLHTMKKTLHQLVSARTTT
ncbi:MAG: lacto-N-biose phosphorylase central domain-containing protein [Coprococcus sp.]